MNMRFLVLCGLLVLPSAGYGSAAVSDVSNAPGKSADAKTEPVTEAQAYLDGIDHTLALAVNGEYGKLRRGSDSRLRAARDRIANLLKGHSSTTELEPEDLIALVNAEAVIKSVIRNQDKDRIVCTLAPGTGSRLASKECLTIAEREARSRTASDGTKFLQRNIMYPKTQ